MTLLYMGLSVFPIVKVESVCMFALKIVLIIERDEPRGRRHPRFGTPASRGDRSLGCDAPLEASASWRRSAPAS